MENGKKEPDLNELKELVAKCEKERDEYLDGWKRAKADFSNYKKEELKRFEEFARLSNAALVAELIGVLDSFDLGLAVLENDKAAQKGFLLIKNQLEDLLKKYGLEKIAVLPGDAFDPSRHEAVGEVKSEKPVGAVAEEVEKGYLLGGKVIRPARVNLSAS